MWRYLSSVQTYDPVGNDYTIGLLLLVATAVIALVFTAVRLHTREPDAAKGAPV